MHNIIDFADKQLGIKLYDGQRIAIDEYYQSGKPNWLLLSGRRGGKSLLSDVIACYEAIIPDMHEYLRPNEDRYILIVSVKEDNAKLHIKNIAKLLKHTKPIGSMIKAVKDDRIELSNGAVILSLPASARAARGYTASALILDEAAWFIDSLGNSSLEAIYTALQPTTATFGDNARIVITTSVNAKAGLVYELYERALSGELDEWHVLKTGTRDLNPKVSERIISNAMRRDPEGAAAEYYSEFREQTESFLQHDAIEACIDKGLVSKIDTNKSYLMAIDPALLKDNYAYGVAHREGGVIILDYIYRLTAPVNANAAEDLLRSLVERYKPRAVLCDNASTVQRLQMDLPMRYTPFTRPQKLRIYSALKESINLGYLALPYDEALLDELKALQIRGGVDISAPKSGRITHDDLADVLALLVDGLQGNEFTSTVRAMPNIFYGDGYEGKSLEEFIFYPDGRYGHAPRKNTAKHPDGITWRNCRKRNAGCEACVAELEAEGIYDNQRLEAEIRAQNVPDYEEMARQDARLKQLSTGGRDYGLQQFFKQIGKKL